MASRLLFPWCGWRTWLAMSKNDGVQTTPSFYPLETLGKLPILPAVAMGGTLWNFFHHAPPVPTAAGSFSRCNPVRSGSLGISQADSHRCAVLQPLQSGCGPLSPGGRPRFPPLRRSPAVAIAPRATPTTPNRCAGVFERSGLRRVLDVVDGGPPEGLGAGIRTLKHLCRDDAEALDLLDRMTQTPHGGDHKSDQASIKFDNVQVDTPAPTGNSKDAALRRLRKDRPDLHAKTVEAIQERVRRTSAEGVLKIGEELAAAQERLANNGNGTFGKWVAERLGMSRMSSSRAIQAYRTFGMGDCNKLLQSFDASALYILSAESTPEEATTKALELAEQGEQITHADASARGGWCDWTWDASRR